MSKAKLGLLLDKFDVKPMVTSSGLRTITRSNHVETTSQLVLLRLIGQQRNIRYSPRFSIDWFTFMEDMRQDVNKSKLAPIIGVKLRVLLNGTDGVKSAEFNNTQFKMDKGVFNVSGICFTHECGSKEEVIL